MTSKAAAVNIHDSGCDAYIGRGSGQHMNNTPVGKKGWLGNPYPLSEYSREESIALFKRDFYARLEVDVEFAIAVRQLAGKQTARLSWRCDCRIRELAVMKSSSLADSAG